MNIECKPGWESNLVAGQLYVTALNEISDDGVEYVAHGQLVYWTGDELVYEDGEPYYGDFDFLVPQGCAPNHAFIAEAI